jgi:short-subunit dehydrogenase
MTEKSLLITGCSSGIGLCAATLLKKRGYRVFASARKPTDVETLKTKGFESVQLDVNDRQSIAHAIDYILSNTQGKLDALFNNSGYLQAGAIDDLSQEMIKAQFETNVFGPMELIRLVLPIMRKQGQGRIIQNSSILGIVTLPYYGAYNASKFALEGFTHTLRQELHGTDIHVSLINPGPIHSKLRDNAYQLYKNAKSSQSDSCHQAAYQHLEKSYFNRSARNDRMKLPPEAVITKLIHALESNSPKPHYYVGLPAHFLAWLKRILPDCALDWVLAHAT